MNRTVEVAVADGLRESAYQPTTTSSSAAELSDRSDGTAVALTPESALPLVRTAALAVLEAESVEDAILSVALLDDEAIADLNRRYLHHDGPTDVLSFPLHEPGEDPDGDVYIGYEQAIRQARDLGIPPSEELVRLAIHGTLHLLGYTHPDGEEREGSNLWRRQETLVEAVLAEWSGEGR